MQVGDIAERGRQRILGLGVHGMERRNFTLPDLEGRLDALAEGALHQITRRDYERLFGVNNAALGRLRRKKPGRVA